MTPEVIAVFDSPSLKTVWRVVLVPDSGNPQKSKYVIEKRITDTLGAEGWIEEANFLREIAEQNWIAALVVFALVQQKAASKPSKAVEIPVPVRPEPAS